MWQQQNVRAPLRRQDDKEQNRPAQLMIPDTQHRLLILAIIFSVLHKIASAIYKYNQRGKPTSLHRAVGHTTKAVKGETKREDLRKWHFSCLVISWVHHALCQGKGALLLKKGVDKRKKISFLSLHLVFIKEKWILFKSKHTDLNTLKLALHQPFKILQEQRLLPEPSPMQTGKGERRRRQHKTVTKILSGLNNKSKK